MNNCPLLSSIEAAIMAYQRKRRNMFGDPFEITKEIIKMTENVKENAEFEREFLACSQGRRKVFMDIFIHYLEDNQSYVEQMPNLTGDFISDNAFRLIDVLCNNSSLFCAYIPLYSERTILYLYERELKRHDALRTEISQRLLRVKASEIRQKAKNPKDTKDFDNILSDLNTTAERLNTFGQDYIIKNQRDVQDAFELAVNSLSHWMNILANNYVALNGEALYEVCEFREKIRQCHRPISDYFKYRFDWLNTWLNPSPANAKVISDRMAYRRNYVLLVEALNKLYISVFYHQFQPALRLLKDLQQFYSIDRDCFSYKSIFMYQLEYLRLQQEAADILYQVLDRIHSSRNFIIRKPIGKCFIEELDNFVDFILRMPQINRWHGTWLKIYEQFMKPRYWT